MILPEMKKVPEGKNVELHWFSLVFQHGERNANAYRSNFDKKITLHDIDSAKRYVKFPRDALLSNCSYLGYMSKATFRGVNSRET